MSRVSRYFSFLSQTCFSPVIVIYQYKTYQDDYRNRPQQSGLGMILNLTIRAFDITIKATITGQQCLWGNVLQKCSRRRLKTSTLFPANLLVHSGFSKNLDACQRFQINPPQMRDILMGNESGSIESRGTVSYCVYLKTTHHIRLSFPLEF